MHAFCRFQKTKRRYKCKTISELRSVFFLFEWNEKKSIMMGELI